MSIQIKGKFIRPSAIDGDKILLKSGQAIRILDQSGQEKRLIELTAEGKVLVNGSEVALKSQLDAAYAELSASIASEAATRAAEDTAIRAEIAQEAYARMAADEDLDSRLEVERLRALAAEQHLQEEIDAVEFALQQEVARAQAREAELQSEIDAEEALRASEDARVLSEAKAYTDSEITSRVTSKFAQPNGLATLDANGKLSAGQIPAIAITDVFVVTTLAQRDALTVQTGDVAKVTEAVEVDGLKLPRTYIYTGSEWLEIESESDVDSVNGKVGAVVLGTADIAETSETNRYYTPAREQAAKDYADSRADDFGERLAVEAFTVTSATISANFVELQTKAFSASIVASIDRLMLLEGEDYTVSLVDGKTRLTFTGSLVQPPLGSGEEALEAGDKIRVRYMKDFKPGAQR